MDDDKTTHKRIIQQKTEENHWDDVKVVTATSKMAVARKTHREHKLTASTTEKDTRVIKVTQTEEVLE